MSDRLDEALAAWRERTEGARAPHEFTDGVMGAVAPPFATMLAAFGRPAFFAASIVSAVLVLAAASSVRALARDAAEYALSRGP